MLLFETTKTLLLSVFIKVITLKNSHTVTLPATPANWRCVYLLADFLWFLQPVFGCCSCHWDPVTWPEPILIHSFCSEFIVMRRSFHRCWARAPLFGTALPVFSLPSGSWWFRAGCSGFRIQFFSLFSFEVRLPLFAFFSWSGLSAIFVSLSSNRSAAADNLCVLGPVMGVDHTSSLHLPPHKCGPVYICCFVFCFLQDWY